MTFIGGSGITGLFILLIFEIFEFFGSKKIDYKQIDYYKVHDSIVKAREVQKKDEYDPSDYFLNEELKKCKDEKVKSLIASKVSSYELTTTDAKQILKDINARNV